MNNIQKQIQWILQDKYGGRLTSKAKKDIERLKTGEPVDYIIGFKNFLGCKVNLSMKPLIPRAETEFWVQKAIEDLRFKNYYLRILDIFAGSGCIGVAVLKHIKNAKVVFADNNKSFLEQIKINCKLNHMNKNKYEIIQSDIFSSVKGKFDYIFANPPYIPINKKNKIQKSVLKYEPQSSYFSGPDGLFHINKFLSKAKNFLIDRGRIYMEFDYIQKKQIEKLLKKLKYRNFVFFKDQYGKFRYFVVE